MKRILFTLIICSLISSCASVGPAGQWNYTVTGTPQGDFTGEMTVTKNDKGYAAKMKNKEDEINFNSFTYDKKEKKTVGSFDFSGTSVEFNALLAKDQLKGTMNAGGMEFPFTATKKK